MQNQNRPIHKWPALIFLFTSGCLLTAGFNGCNKVKFSTSENFKSRVDDEFLVPNGFTEENYEDIRLILKDSFERDRTIDNSPEGFQWNQFVGDNGAPVVEGSGNGIDDRIFSKEDLGPVPLERKALFFYGRPGSSIHDIYLLSRPIDLTNFDNLLVSFSYLLTGLEKAETRGGGEFLRLEICDSALSECGINGANSFNADTFESSSNWKVLYDTRVEDVAAYDQRSGKDHNLSDWTEKSIKINLADHAKINKAQFTFRIHARLTDGFINTTQPFSFSNNIDDGITLDDVTVYAARKRRVQ